MNKPKTSLMQQIQSLHLKNLLKIALRFYWCVTFYLIQYANFRSSQPGVFLGKGVLKIRRTPMRKSDLNKVAKQLY